MMSEVRRVIGFAIFSVILSSGLAFSDVIPADAKEFFIDKEKLEQLPAIANEIKQHSNLNWLYLQCLEGCTINQAQAKLLADAINENTSIKAVSIYKAQMSDEAGAILITALAAKEGITEIYFWHTNVRDQFALALAKALKSTSTTLEQCFLWHPAITNIGAKAIAEALKENKTLKKLTIANSLVDNKGAKAFANALRKNGTLESLYLNQHYPSELWKKFCEYLNMSGYFYDEEILNEIEILLHHNKSLRILKSSI